MHKSSLILWYDRSIQSDRLFLYLNLYELYFTPPVFVIVEFEIYFHLKYFRFTAQSGM